MSFTPVKEYRSDLSVSKLLSIVDQSLFDCLVSCQDHYFLMSKVDCEHWSIFLGQLMIEKCEMFDTQIEGKTWEKIKYRVRL